MNKTIKKLSPLWVVLLGLLLLFYMGMAIPAGICLLIGYTMAVESVWPEKWGSDNK